MLQYYIWKTQWMNLICLKIMSRMLSFQEVRTQIIKSGSHIILESICLKWLSSIGTRNLPHAFHTTPGKVSWNLNFKTRTTWKSELKNQFKLCSLIHWRCPLHPFLPFLLLFVIRFVNWCQLLSAIEKFKSFISVGNINNASGELQSECTT